MFTVLLADDDENVLKNLRNSISWDVYGIENILTALDGSDAWDILTQTHVDLLITDIRMPNMDGLELIQRTQEHYPYIRCILLSSHSDFAYAKTAISLGVENYLLKPYKIEELEDSIRKALDNISMHKHVMQTLFLDNILYRWVTDDISYDELVNRSKHIGVNVFFRQYCVILIKSSIKKSLDLFLSSVFSALKSQCDVYHFMNYDGYHVIILGGHTITQPSIEDLLNTIVEGQPTDQRFPFQAAIGIIAEGCEEVSQSYRSALECMLTSQNNADQQITLSNKKISFEFSNLLIHQITESLIKSDVQDDVWATEFFYNSFPDINAFDLQELNSLINILSVKLALSLNASGLIDSDAQNNIINNAYYFLEFPKEEEIIQWFCGLISICQIMIKKHQKCLSPIILLAIKYITDNYSEYLSIKDFCAKTKMNASYLGLLFKKETGIYFNDYINQVRINHSIELLKNNNLKTIEVCKQVGFANTSYFIRCFKKQTGVSPSKFRQLYIDL